MKNGIFFNQPPMQYQTKHIVDEIIPANQQVLTASAPGEGKSLIAQGILYSVAYGAPFAEIFGTVAGNVMFVDSENPFTILKNRCERIKKGLEMSGYQQLGEVDFLHSTRFIV